MLYLTGYLQVVFLAGALGKPIQQGAEQGAGFMNHPIQKRKAQHHVAEIFVRTNES